MYLKACDFKFGIHGLVPRLSNIENGCTTGPGDMAMSCNNAAPCSTVLDIIIPCQHAQRGIGSSFYKTAWGESHFFYYDASL